MSATLGYIILYVPEVDGAMSFYEAAFGFARKFLHEEGSYGELSTGGTTLAFATEDLADSHGIAYRKSRRGGEASAFEVAFVTADVEAQFRRALDNGATELAEPKEMPWGQTVGYVADPNGFTIEICSPIG